MKTLNYSRIAALAAGILLMTPSVFGLPVLQLDIDGESSVSGTTYSDGPVFELQALGLNPSGTYYISAAISPKTTASLSSFGSFSIDGTTYSIANGNVHFGTPPVEDALKNPDSSDLPSHDIFTTHYAEIAFSFGTTKIPAYNVQTGDPKAGKELNIETFDVDISGLLPGFTVHFDLYNVFTSGAKTGQIDKFAPFSHDAEGTPGTNVPDGGGTAALLGLGLLGMAAMRRKN